MNIRPLTRFDTDDISKIEERCFPTPWSLQSVRAEIKNPLALYLGAFVEGELIGYAGMHMIVDEGYITNIAVMPNNRGRGIAGSLLGGLFEAAAKRGLRFIGLEVRESNETARKLYTKHGFTEVGVRKDYYKQPKEDAVLMNKPMGGDAP